MMTNYLYDFVYVTLGYDDDKVLKWFHHCNISLWWWQSVTIILSMWHWLMMMTKCHNDFVNVTLARCDWKHILQSYHQCNISLWWWQKMLQWFIQCTISLCWWQIDVTRTHNKGILRTKVQGELHMGPCIPKVVHNKRVLVIKLVTRNKRILVIIVCSCQKYIQMI